ncbi:MAG: glycoside hydrolase family 5 protein [Capsulimonas sp.]|uniref:glycoside hydrolase family 5 protein n=1 Tax=Capsulimonas sp. TaxID=2494211 RepID=UPI0032669ED6
MKFCSISTRNLRPLIAAGSAISGLLMPSTAFAQLPTPTYGWNLGNTMEPPCGVGCWGGTPSQGLINAVGNAGFNTVRIPCAWDSHADQKTYQIDAAYMAQVKQVVDWCYARGLTVIVNDHWDGGWLENHLTGAVDPKINAKMKSYWTQIAATFAGYDHRLLFAAANEPSVKTAEQMSELMTYYQTFVDAVRAGGSNNNARWLVVQGPTADIDATSSLMNTLPKDPTPRRLMVEIHFYGPYQFCLMDSDQSWGKMFYFWGQGYHSATLPSRNATWGEEAVVDAQFQKMYDKFASKGIPVIVGELRAEPRKANQELDGANLELNHAATTYWNKYVVDSAQSHGLSPICWDTPGSIFDFKNGVVLDPAAARSMTGGSAVPPPGGDGAQYCFELSKQGVTSSGKSITDIALSTARKYAGSQSLALSFSGAASSSSVSVAAPSTPAGKKITFRVWIPKGSKISAVQPYAIDRNRVRTGTSKPIKNLKTNAWNTLTVTVPSKAATPLQQCGVQFTASAQWTGTCYVDSISW